MGTAQTKANNKYKAKAYDRIEINVPKGRKDELQALAQAQGESLNGFVNTAIDERVARLKGAQGNTDTIAVEPALLGMGNLLVFTKANDDNLSAVYIERKTGAKYKIYQDDDALWDEPKKAELWLSNLYTEYRTGIKYQVYPHIDEDELSEFDKEAKTQ